MEAVRPVILLVENDDADVFLFRRALGKHNFTGTLRVLATINAARCYLAHQGEFTDHNSYPRPDLIVSDMNLGGHLGTELLEWLRQQPDLTDIPFVFLSGSYLPPDKSRARELRADRFYHKTGDMEQATEHAAEILELLHFKLFSKSH